MHVIHLAEPRIEGQRARFGFRAEPAIPLYRREGFDLTFPASVDLAAVPRETWWRVALICLHAQWPLAGPCRVVLPVRLGPGEAEFWRRLCAAGTMTLAAHAGRDAAGPGLEIVEAGPPVPPAPAAPADGPVIACFSGGRDSLTQAALLQELGEQPILVTTTSPREASVEHETPRRREVLAEMVRRRGLELVEVHSDLRAAWVNEWSSEPWATAVSETSDCLFFFAVGLAVAAARGGRAVFLASELEAQENVALGGAVVQHRHFMYSAATQRALAALLEPSGIGYGGLTSALEQCQVYHLLARRYGDLLDLQYSCWELGLGESACSRCSECRLNAWNAMAEGIDPAVIGIDLAELLVAQAGWRPGAGARARIEARRRRALPGEPANGLPGDRVPSRAEEHQLRCVQRVPPETVEGLLAPASPERRDAALRAYRALRDALPAVSGPERGYRAGYLELVDPRLRGSLEAIFAEHFEREPREEHAPELDRTIRLSDWVAAPLRAPAAAATPGAGGPAPRARPPAPAPPTEAELAPIRHLIPDPEPPLRTPESGRVIRVSGTRLDGNERRYLEECVDTNWVSSTGPFVTRFERVFAAAAGCRFAVACSSGTTALQLALAAAGIGPGDEVIVPAFTMIATANTVAHCGAIPVFVDTDPRTWNLDLGAVREAIGPATRAIVLMHTYGQPVDAEPFRALADANSLVLVEDAAEAHGAECRGRRVGSLGDAAAFSLYGNKIVTAGEGGVVTTDDPAIDAVARELRDHGFSPERHFWHRFRAFNFRMSNVQAAVGLAQVERLDELLAGRRRIAARYRDRLRGTPGLVLPPEIPGLESAHWMYGLLVEPAFGADREDVRRHLAARGIETRTFFVPLHLQPAYLRDERDRRHPVAERFGRTGLYLPTGPELTDADVDTVAAAVLGAREVYAAARPSPS